MNKFRDFDIQFHGLNQGTHNFSYKLDMNFFDLFDVDQNILEFSDCKANININLVKGSALIELFFKLNASIFVQCDISTEYFWLDIKSNWKTIIKFSEYYDDSSDEFLILPLGEHKLNIANLIYENILITVPLKKISPNAKNKDLERFITNQDKYKNENIESEESSVWDKLKNLKIK